MLWKIVKRELREHLLSFRFAVILALTLLLMVASAMVFSVGYGNALRDYPRRVEGLVDEEGKTNLQGVPCSGFNVRRMPVEMAFCAGSAARELPQGANLNANEMSSISRRGTIEGALGGSAHVDWVFVVAAVLSFGAGVLTYRSISGELQDGTLALVLANPVSRGVVFVGKYLAALLTLGMSLTIGGVLGLLVLRWLAPVDFGAEEWLKLALAGVLSLLYLSCAVLIGLHCSVFGRSPVISAVTFLFIWAALVFVVPNLGGVLVGQLRPVDRQAQIHAAFVAVDERLPHEPGMDAFALAEVDRERAQAQERVLIQYIDELVRQVRLGRHLTRISPASTFTYAVEEATGGGIGRLEKFVDNVVRFRRGVFTAVVEADREDPESEHRYRPYYCGGSQFSQRKVDLGPAKEFKDPPPSSAEGLEAALLALALLVLYNGVLFLVTYLRFVRQDVAPGAAL